ncbi:MAG TPA: DsbA family protein [Polymorphobacter sp.]|nr:DsbA family protein [Polymorphobacter sp.]
MKRIEITYFSDLLCIWAWFAQPRIDEVRANFGDRVTFVPRFCSVFGDTARKIPAQWGDKGSYDGFNAHLLHAAAGFPEITVNAQIWRSVRPASSLSPQLLLKAVQLADAAVGSAHAEAAALALRRAFFVEARDIADAGVQREALAAAGADLAAVDALLGSGAAHAALASDYKDADALGVQGSPTFILNDGRQKLFGNIGYRILEANIEELLRAPDPDQASWC